MLPVGDALRWFNYLMFLFIDRIEELLLVYVQPSLLDSFDKDRPLQWSKWIIEEICLESRVEKSRAQNVRSTQISARSIPSRLTIQSRVYYAGDDLSLYKSVYACLHSQSWARANFPKRFAYLPFGWTSVVIAHHHQPHYPSLLYTLFIERQRLGSE